MNAKILLAFMIIPSTALAQEDQPDYLRRLLGELFGFVFLASVVIGLIILIMCFAFLFQQLNDKDHPAKFDRKPVTLGAAVTILVLVSVFISPLKLVVLISDFMGLGGERQDTCLVMNVNPVHSRWVNDANACVDKLYQAAMDYGKLTNKDNLANVNLDLLFGVIQLLALIFLISSTLVLSLHQLGYRQLPAGRMACIGSMLAASILMQLPETVAYFKDLSGQDSIEVIS
jgi:amino acid transporter